APPGCRKVQIASRARTAPGRLEYELEDEEPADQQGEEEPDQSVEVAVDEALDPGPEEEDQPGDQEEAEAPADDARHDENGERDAEDAGREGEDLVRDRREAGDEDRPEVPALVERADRLERFRRDAGHVGEEEVVERGPEAPPKGVPDHPA